MTSRSPVPSSISRRQSLAALSLGMFASGPFPLFGADSAALPPLRICMSDRVVSGVNINDAKASLRIWSREIIANSAFEFVPDMEIILPSAPLLQAIRAGSIDLMCLTIEEYMQVREFVDLSTIVLNEFGGTTLVLVVNEDRGINKMADLRGRSIQILDVALTTLALPWISVALRREGLPGPTQFFSRVNRNTKLPQVVLPVFFGQMDACIVTREGLKVMGELNPQLSRKLKIISSSPPMFSTLFACRRGLAPAFRKRILEQIVAAKSIPAAKQLLTLFQSPGYALGDPAALQPSIQLLDAYHRLQSSERAPAR